MKKTIDSPQIINSVPELFKMFGMPDLEHPLIGVTSLELLRESCPDLVGHFVYNFYSICIKKDFNGKMKYGQNYYDFNSGTMSFLSPGQVVSTSMDDEMSLSGWCLIFHPDLISKYPLGKNIKNYSFFSYEVHEALHLSDKEELMLSTLMQNIANEYKSSIDKFSQDVLVSHIELMLNYCNRFYNRQFITRQSANPDILSQVENILDEYFNNDQALSEGLPSVQYISDQLNMSPNYLSDMLRNLTGQSTQQHIQNKLMEKAKEILTTTNLSVSQIAYQLGFEYPQSFNKFFKNKMKVSPLTFRQSFN
ncbi:helix-turn-helix domain-containing protein [Fulvivirga ligni]|uniref:helix-turn-helix domain-containing protein n=1 Tax=Fulvivirga ligni TaxID=2904246 RepID=UPI001F256B37|nr:response regulator transcription factor [Fulvivirga ligni]UII23167.1 helix-turn-helix transcriptional regulator [Fulvivirga ligni]